VYWVLKKRSTKTGLKIDRKVSKLGQEERKDGKKSGNRPKRESSEGIILGKGTELERDKLEKWESAIGDFGGLKTKKRWGKPPGDSGRAYWHLAGRGGENCSWEE